MERGSLNRMTFLATVHCLAGCAMGEITGMVIGTALGFGNPATIGLAFVLAYVSGFGFTAWPFLRHGYGWPAAARIALAADTASITVMEIVDNLIMWWIPGAMDAPLDSMLFWGSLAFALSTAGVAAFPLNRALIRRGRGYALAHAHHGHHVHPTLARQGGHQA